MPLAAVSINDFKTSVMRETTQEDELKVRLIDLYEKDKRLHEFECGTQAIKYFESSFNGGQRLYVGIFNDKPICAVGSELDSHKQTLTLNNLAMHTQNMNRGIEQQFIHLILQEVGKTSVNSLTLISQQSQISDWILRAQG